MSDEGPFVLWPRAGEAPLFWATVVGVALLVGAFLIEILRRRRERRLRLAAEWRAVRKIAGEKELSSQEREILETIIRGHTPASPLKAATTRQLFDACVARDMEAHAAAENAASLEERGILLRDIRTRLGLDYIPLGLRIHSTRELYTGQLIWVAAHADAASKWFRMSVMSVDEAHFRLAPQAGEAMPPFKAGQELRCRMWREEDARYTFTARLAHVEDTPPLWALRHASDLKRMQSRAHFRIRHEQAANVGVLNAPIDGDTSDVAQREVITRLRGRITSLSGGGFAVEVSQPVPKQVLLRVPLELGAGGETLETTARLISCASLSSGRHLLRAAFVAMDEAAHETIAHYVFQQQQLKGAGAPGEPE